MKKITAMILILSLLFGMSACTDGPKPQDTVKTFCEAMKTYDYDAMRSCLERELDPEDIIPAEQENLSGLSEYLKHKASDMTYTIGSAEISGDNAKVPVTMEYTDVSPVLGEAVANYLMEVIASVFTGLSEDEMDRIFANELALAISHHETKRAAQDVSFDLVRVNGEWKIKELPEEAVTVMTGNMAHAMDSLDEMFGGGEDWTVGVEPADYPISDVVLFSNDSAAMTVLSGGTDEFGDSVFKVLCENKSGKTLTFSVDDASVNGWQIPMYLSEDVAPGKTSTVEFDVYESTLEDLGIKTPDKIELFVEVYDEDGWQNDSYVVNDCFAIYPTGLTDSQVVVPKRPSGSNELVLADTDAFTMILLGRSGEELWGYSLDAYVKNKTGKVLYYTWEDVSVNDVMCDPYWGITLPAGQQTLTTISFSDDDFENNGIVTAEKIGFTLQVYDNKTMDELYSQTLVYEP